MQPMGRHPVRFPGKQDYHVKKDGLLNWWEADMGTSEKKRAERRASKQAANDEAYDYMLERKAG